MAMKYDAMIAINKAESEKKIHIAKKRIKTMLDNGVRISVVELARSTGLSRGFFYKNLEVREEMEQAIKKQGTVPKRKYMNKEADDTVSPQFEVIELKACNEKLLEENQKLKKEVEVLKNKIARKEISILKKI